MEPDTAVVLPALDEEAALPGVLRALPREGIREVVVVDNGSTDGTVRAAREAGATVVVEPRRGYGSACLAGVAHLARGAPPTFVAFLDADGSDDPTELPALLAPLRAGCADLVIGSRTLGTRERGALLPQARVGNAVACALLRVLYGQPATDLGPFRAVRWDRLAALGMRDPAFGWTVEMQARAARARLVTVEVPVSYRRRIGRSKITGTVTGSVRAGAGILSTLVRIRLGRGRR